VAPAGDKIQIRYLPPGSKLSREGAYNLAAWLVALGGDFERFREHYAAVTA
jgi:hypothetical protein